jgi:hypothetical protein
MQMIHASPESRNISPKSASTDLVKLLRKLRWIGMEEEARQLEIALSRFPPEQTATVLADAPSTD